jgi:hypothetical protein
VRSHRGPFPNDESSWPDATEPVAPVNVSPDSRSGMTKARLVITAHIGTYALAERVHEGAHIAGYALPIQTAILLFY